MRNIMEDYGLAMKIANSFYLKDPAYDVHDLAQVAAMGIMKAYKNYDPAKGSFSTYAFQAGRNEILSSLKKHRNYKIHNKHESYLDDINPEEYISDNWTETDKSIFRLKLDGYTTKEIAENLNLTSFTVTNRIRAIREHIKKQND